MRLRVARTLGLAALLATQASCASLPGAAPETGDVAETIRATEHQRLRLLVAGEAEAARALHSPDFQLVNPVGRTLTLDEYLGSVGSGYVDYLAWTPGPIEVRVAGDLAVIRYRAELRVTVDGRPAPSGPHWHTDAYERVGGRWRVLWSQATTVVG